MGALQSKKHSVLTAFIEKKIQLKTLQILSSTDLQLL